MTATSCTTDNSKRAQDAQEQPQTMADMDDRTGTEWLLSFGAAMVPFSAFLWGHSKGMTVRVVEATIRSPVGVYGLFFLPFGTLAFEKCVYDTVQAIQGIDPNIKPADRGGFPSGGADLPAFNLVPVQPRRGGILSLPSIPSFLESSSSSTTTTAASTTQRLNTKAT